MYELKKVAGARPWLILSPSGWRVFSFVDADFRAATQTLDRLNDAAAEHEAELLAVMASDAG